MEDAKTTFDVKTEHLIWTDHYSYDLKGRVFNSMSRTSVSSSSIYLT